MRKIDPRTKAPFTYEEMAAAFFVQDGVLFRRFNHTNGTVDQPVTRLDRNGYLVLTFRRVHLYAHRVVWLLTHCEWPMAMVDHINRVPADNRPENLRLVSASENQQNRASAGNCGFKGVTRHKQTGKFQAACGKTYLGLHSTPEAAAQAYDAEASKRYGKFACLNFGSAT